MGLFQSKERGIHYEKTSFSLLLALVMVLSALPIPQASAAGTYSVDKAIAYAKAHWNDGKGKCAEFVSRCAIAGGLSMKVEGGTGPCWRAIQTASGLKKQDVKLDKNGYATKALNGDNIAAGDVMVQWCKTHDIAPHLLFCGGYDSKGYATFYAHNGAMNNERYDLGTNTSEEHTKKCDMGGQVIRLSTLDPSKSAPSVTFSNTLTPSNYSAYLKTSVSYTGSSAPTGYGYLFGTSKDNLRTYLEGIIGTAKNPIPLELNFINLEHNTTYYYQPYVVMGGKTYYDSIRSFTTTKDTAAISVASEIQCGYNITIPANTDVFFYGSPTSKEVQQHSSPFIIPYTLFCTARLAMSDGSIRYLYTDSQGTKLYFRANPNMKFETVHNFVQEKVDAKYLVREGVYYKSCACGEAGTETFTYGTAKPQEFKDVPTNAYYHNAVMWAVQNNITSGTGDGTTFEPNAICTRGQVVTFLWRAAGQPEPKSTVNPFKDVKSSDYFYKAVLWAKENNITSGTGDGSTFEPNTNCNRAQIVTFLSRAKNGKASSSRNPFKDVPANAYYYHSVLWAVENGITTGTGDGSTFEPNAFCTRGQVITFLSRAYKK